MQKRGTLPSPPGLVAGSDLALMTLKAARLRHPIAWRAGVDRLTTGRLFEASFRATGHVTNLPHLLLMGY